MQLDISKDVNELNKRFAEWMIGFIGETLATKDRFTIALSGGSTPRKLYDLLASDGYKNRIEWKKIHFFWGDERFVPISDDRNNAKLAFDHLLNLVPVDPLHIHVMPTNSQPEESAAAYEKILHEYFDGQEYSFDLVLLGMGDNAHTLSLFPGYEVIHEQKRWVISLFLKEQDMHRVTLTVPIVNKAARVAFLVAGADKASPLFHVLYGEHDPDLYPAQLIQPYATSPYWFVDQAAASDLE